MRRSITIDEKAYNLLALLKTGPRDSFSKVILRHFHKPANTCGQLLERMESYVPPVELMDLDKFIKSRGHRSNRK
jgi:predicted CopG family antitoxin